MFRSLEPGDSCDSFDSEESKFRQNIIDYNNVLDMKLFDGRIVIKINPADKIYSLCEPNDSMEYAGDFPVCFICTMLIQPTKGT
jgi:hypothetical protein